jgi:hypothetical protein
MQSLVLVSWCLCGVNIFALPQRYEHEKNDNNFNFVRWVFL